jgi:hypothetical protein
MSQLSKSDFDKAVKLQVEIERLRTRAALLEQLLGECIRNKYYDEACSPSWLKEAKQAVGLTDAADEISRGHDSGRLLKP